MSNSFRDGILTARRIKMLKWQPQKSSESDPNDFMVGKCGTCKQDVVVQLKDTIIRNESRMAECPSCKAAVFVVTKPKIVEKEIPGQ